VLTPLAIAILLMSSAPAEAATRRTTDSEARVRFTLDGRVLTVRVLSRAPRYVRRLTFGRRVRASCGTRFPFTRGVTVRRTRAWPRGRRRLRFRFDRDISRRARWCHLEHPRRGDIAFGSFR